MILTRLAEAIRPMIGGSFEDIVGASKTVLDDGDTSNPDVRGPRVATAVPGDRSVSMGLG